MRRSWWMPPRYPPVSSERHQVQIKFKGDLSSKVIRLSQNYRQYYFHLLLKQFLSIQSLPQANGSFPLCMGYRVLNDAISERRHRCGIKSKPRLRDASLVQIQFSSEVIRYLRFINVQSVKTTMDSARIVVLVGQQLVNNIGDLPVTPQDFYWTWLTD